MKGPEVFLYPARSTNLGQYAKDIGQVQPGFFNATGVSPWYFTRGTRT